MANLYMCGFEWGTVRELSQFFRRSDDDVKYRDEQGYMNTPVSAPSGDYGYETSMYLTGNYVVYPAREEVYIQFALKSNSYSSFYGEDGMFWWNTNSGSQTIGGLGVTNAGQIYLWTWNPAKAYGDYSPHIIVGSGIARLQNQTWYVIELRIKSHNTIGAIEVRVDGITDISFSGCTAPAGGYNYSDRMGWYAFDGYFIDDVVVNDTTGSNNNSWPNQMKIVLLKPNSEGDYSQWDKEGGLLGYDNVNNVPSDPSTYVYSTTSNEREMYHLESVPDEALEIAVVRSSAWTNRASKNLSQIIYEVKTGGSIYSSPGQNLYLSPHHISYAWDVNPDTGNPWTVYEVNNMQGGFKSNV